jgi:hypothetical protein
VLKHEISTFKGVIKNIYMQRKKSENAAIKFMVGQEKYIILHIIKKLNKFWSLTHLELMKEHLSEG